MTLPAAPSTGLGTANTSAATSDSRSAPTHIGHGSWVVKIVTSVRCVVPSLRDASRSAPITACAVGSLDSATRLAARATIASFMTAIAPTAGAPRSAAWRASASASPMNSS